MRTCADDTALPPAFTYSTDSKNIQGTWVEDVKVGERMAPLRVSGSGWSNNGLDLAGLHTMVFFTRHLRGVLYRPMHLTALRKLS